MLIKRIFGKKKNSNIMTKSKITRTYGPIHFEDLEPHRFEDLVRELIYDYKDWQTIEATGRSGNDEGFDVRAYEKIYRTLSSEKDVEEELSEGVHPMEGNLWMIQGKREKEIGPKKVREILTDIDSKNPPYGYILAASANFSKDSYDAFREELRKKGVMEFYLWGKAELEDMLYLPKNDRILFAFFGVSLVSKRRSRVTEIRQVIINKNKLFRILGDSGDFYESVLLRDSNDVNYPYKIKYKDFNDHPRWLEYRAIDYHPKGLIVILRKHFAYIDIRKKEYDFTEVSNMIFRESDSDKDRQKRQEEQRKVESYWEYLPHRHQAMFIRNGLIKYDEMLVIDDKGDNSNKFPHIFVDFDLKDGPIAGSYEYIEVNGEDISIEGYKRVNKFPKSFSEPVIGKIHEKKGITLNDPDFSMLKHGNKSFRTLYEYDGRYNFLKISDIVLVLNQDNESSSKYYLQITHIDNKKLKDYIKLNPNEEWMIKRQIGDNPDMNKILNIYEFKLTYDFIVEREKEKRNQKIKKNKK